MDDKAFRELAAEYERPDHWNYKSDPYELRKYEQTLALVPPGRYERVLEIGCSEGAFTRRLAPLADDVLGVDIVPVALERARAECTGLRNVRFNQLDLVRDSLDERFDLIFCAEVLYYLRWTRMRPVTRKIVDWLRPGGYLVAVHVTGDVVASWGFGLKGAELTHRLFERPEVRRVRDQREEGYMLSLFQKDTDVVRSRRQELIEDLCGQQYPNLAQAVLGRGLARLRRAPRRLRRELARLRPTRGE